jgi:hypothetical protein
MDAFISEDGLHTFEGYLKYQGVDASISTLEELTEWRKIFAEATHRRVPKVGLMCPERLFLRSSGVTRLSGAQSRHRTHRPIVMNTFSLTCGDKL